jgi:hypothetical protein
VKDKPWYYGDVESRIAEGILGKSGSKTFLVRDSSLPNAFALSLNKDGFSFPFFLLISQEIFPYSHLSRYQEQSFLYFGPLSTVPVDSRITESNLPSKGMAISSRAQNACNLECDSSVDSETSIAFHRRRTSFHQGQASTSKA